MSLRELYEGVQIELNKENAPNILLEDFNYFANRAVNQFVNKNYNIYDINQQTTDNLRVLKSTAFIPVTEENKIDYYDILSNVEGSNAAYEVKLPSDYLHILNCVCIYKLTKTYKCYDKEDTKRAVATRLTGDSWSQILDNFWMRPTYNRPYYYIHNINTHNTNPYNPYDSEKGTDVYSVTKTEEQDSDGVNIVKEQISSGSYPNSIELRIGKSGTEDKTVKASLREKTAKIRYGNLSPVRMEIRYGTDNSVFKLVYVQIDYLKAPQYLRLTQKQVDKQIDESQLLEFPDFVCQEILNELVHIIMENISDSRLQTHPVVSQSIANPAQAQAPAAGGQQSA